MDQAAYEYSVVLVYEDGYAAPMAPDRDEESARRRFEAVSRTTRRELERVELRRRLISDWEVLDTKMLGGV